MFLAIALPLAPFAIAAIAARFARHDNFETISQSAMDRAFNDLPR